MNWLYLPILKWKRAEQDGLIALPDDITDKICPVIETRMYQNSTQELYQSIQHYWSNKPLFLDVATPDGLILNERFERLRKVLDYIHQTEDQYLKVCLWSQFINSPFSQDIIEQVNQIGCDVCVRVRVTPKGVDFSSSTFNDPSYIPIISRTLSKCLKDFPGLVAVASGAFPKTKQLNKGFNLVQRDDLAGWLELSDITNMTFAYSDYTCHDPIWEDNKKDKKGGGGPTPPIMRYASLTQWHVRKLTSAQESPESSKFILEDKERVLECSCLGCYEIKQRAYNPSARVGNYPKHLTDGVIHHITTVIKKNLAL